MAGATVLNYHRNVFNRIVSDTLGNCEAVILGVILRNFND